MAEKRPLKVLTEYRAAAGKTQADLAGELEVAVMTVSRWETGDRKIGVKTLPTVAEKTGIPKSALRPDLAESMQEAAQ
jgi:transcriptional regulator with XRE-family HTH domain